MPLTGILLLNLGTPSAPTTKAVRAYLREFLSDPFVLDLPWLLRMCLLYGVLLPFRPKSSSHAYQQIWTADGSPLLVHSKQFQVALQDTLGGDYRVELAMRYAEPNIADAVKRLYKKGCADIVVFPLFPQYSSAATGSALLAATKAFAKYGDFFTVKVCSSFYEDPHYHRAFVNVAQPFFTAFRPDFTLFSYHGLPERHLDKAGCDRARCDRVASCLDQQPDLSLCYRAQCFKSTELIATALNIDKSQYQTVFQSRLGQARWIHPYTDEVLPLLIAAGVKRLLVACPSFVADCLETLEEVGIRLRSQWLSLGGEAFEVVPCLNADPVWVAAFAEMVLSAGKFAQD